MNSCFCRVLVVLIGLSLPAINALNAAQKGEARVTQVIRDVQLLGANVAWRSATVNDRVSEGWKVRTGAEGRAELTFNDRTVARLGANAVFSFKDGTRTLSLEEGSFLLQVPKSSRGARICSGGIAAAVTGTTVVSIVDPKEVEAIDRKTPVPAGPGAISVSTDLGNIETLPKPTPSPTPTLSQAKEKSP